MALKIAFDVGGVISKYPEEFFVLVEVLMRGSDALAVLSGQKDIIEVHVISDMHPRQKISDMLRRNGWNVPYDRVHSADYKAHGESCKAVLCKELGIDILVDDFIGYVATPGSPLVRLLVMPDPALPYYADSWETDGSEGDFGRRKNPAGSKRPPEDR